MNYNSGIKGFFCSECYSLCSINIIEEKDGEIFIGLFCENNHTEKMKLIQFLEIYEKYSKKECQICFFNIDINALFYCFPCNVIFCAKCRETHSLKENINEHIIEPFALKDNKCINHNFKINEYYCIFCKQYFCKECLDNKIHDKHNIINLYTNNDNIKKKLLSIIEIKENSNKIKLKEFNKILLKTKNKFNEINKYRKGIINIKNNIIYNYEKDSYNYNNIQNLNFIEKIFINKEKTKFALSKLYRIININDNKQINNFDENNRKVNEPKNIIFNVQKFNQINEISCNNEQDNKSDINNKKDDNQNEDIGLFFKEKKIFNNNDNSDLVLNNDKNINNNSNNLEYYINKILNNKKEDKYIDEKNKCKNYYKIIHTKKNIKNIFCLSHNNIIISYEISKNSNITLYKIIHDEKEYIKMKYLNYINIIDEEINDLNKYKDESLLICTNKSISKIKINDHEKGEYSIIFKYIINKSNFPKNNILSFDSNFIMCLPLSNINFITCLINKIIYWKKANNLNDVSFVEEKYKLKQLTINNFKIIDIKEVCDNLVVISMTWENNNNTNSYYLLYLNIDKDNNLNIIDNKKIYYELCPNKNSIKKINDNYFLILLNKNGFILIDIEKREIFKKISFNNNLLLYILETKLCGEYLYNFVIEENIEENKLIFKQYKSNISEILNNKIIFESGQELYLNLKNKFKNIGIFFEKKENKNQTDIQDNTNEKENINIDVILVVGYNKIILFNYYP